MNKPPLPKLTHYISTNDEKTILERYNTDDTQKWLGKSILLITTDLVHVLRSLVGDDSDIFLNTGICVPSDVYNNEYINAYLQMIVSGLHLNIAAFDDSGKAVVFFLKTTYKELGEILLMNKSIKQYRMPLYLFCTVLLLIKYLT